MSIDKATGVGGVVLGLIGTGVAWLFPSQRWIGWLFLIAGLLVFAFAIGWAIASHHTTKQLAKEPASNKEQGALQLAAESAKDRVLAESRAGTLEHKLTVLQSEFDDLKFQFDGTGWLRDIAHNQALEIARFLQITTCEIGQHELFFRNDPYLELAFSFDNRSVYDLALCDDLAGSISYKKRELTGELKWIDQPVLPHGEGGSFTIRQNLTNEDVVHLLNGANAAELFLGRLGIKVEGKAAFKRTVLPQPIHLNHLRVTNEQLKKTYPKLEIDIYQAVYGFLIDSRPVLPKTEPTLVTLLLWIQNWRAFTVEVKNIKLRLSVNGKQYVAYADTIDPIHFEFDVSRLGTEVGIGRAAKNLNAETSLKLVEGGRKQGALQFRFPELQFFEVEHDELHGASFTLTLIDANEEEHHQNGFIKGTLTNG
jgi:hypothetical protein